MKDMTVTVTVTGLNVFRFRLWVGSWLISLGAVVIGCSSLICLDSDEKKKA